MKFLYNYVRPFSTQRAENGTIYNNCWACSINAIKGRTSQDSTYLDRFKKDVSFNNPNSGLDFSRVSYIFSQIGIDKVPINFHSDIIKLVDNYEEKFRSRLKGDEEKKGLFDILKILLGQFGPLLMVRQALGCENFFHGLVIVDIEINKNLIYLYDSMEYRAQIIDLDEITDQMLFLVLGIKKNSSIAGLYYDRNFTLEQNKSRCLVS